MIYLRFILLTIVFTTVLSCGSFGGGSQNASNDVSEGTYTIQEGDTELDVVLTDESGNSMSDMDVEYSETNGQGVLIVKDPNNNYGTVVMIGAPEELGSSGRKAHKFNISLSPINKEPIGFAKDAENLGYFYISDSAKKTEWRSWKGVITQTRWLAFSKVNILLHMKVILF